MRWIAACVIACTMGAAISHYGYNSVIFTAIFSALGLLFISKILGEATDQLSRNVGQKAAGLVNVVCSNLAELIIVFFAIRAGLIDLVKAEIVGSMIGNLLLVMGIAIIVGCRKGKVMPFNRYTASMFVKQFFLVALALFLPSFMTSGIAEEHRMFVSYEFALVLIAVYLYYFYRSRHDPRYKEIEQQVFDLDHKWSKQKALFVLFVCAIGAVFHAHLLVAIVEEFSAALGVSQMFLGFILLPIVGNIAENWVAIRAAYYGKAELSLSVAVGSPAQVGMVVAPLAVFFGWLTGHTFTLDFTGLPLMLLVVCFGGTFLVLEDHQWEKSEGIFMIAIYLFIVALLFHAA